MHRLHCSNCRLDFEVMHVSIVGAPCPRCNSWVQLASDCSSGSCLSCGAGQSSCVEAELGVRKAAFSFGNGLLTGLRQFFRRLLHKV